MILPQGPVRWFAASVRGRPNQAHRPHWGISSAVTVRTQTRPPTLISRWEYREVLMEKGSFLKFDSEHLLSCIMKCISVDSGARSRLYWPSS
jgi:hypothetical protein